MHVKVINQKYINSKLSFAQPLTKQNLSKMLRSILLLVVALSSVAAEDDVINEDDVMNEDDVINDDPDDEIVTDDEVADHTYDLPLEPEVVQVESPAPKEEVIEKVMTAPKLTEEELTSQLMPERFLCDTCHIVVFNVSTHVSQKSASSYPKIFALF